MVINEFVFKVASRCNLNCSYCYMYNMGDTTYKKQPKIMSFGTVKAFAKALDRHCIKKSIEIIHIIFHGGEPLLAGKFFFIKCVELINATVLNVEVRYTIQTNGTLLDESWIELFNSLKIQVGISVDGPKKFHDIYRVYHNKNGSFEDVIRGVKVRNNKSIGGLISVININIPPKELYDFYVALEAKSINILLPDSHYDNPPEGMKNIYDKNETKYGDWMIELYEIWSTNEEASRPKIPYFENIMGLLLGFEKGDELIGKRKNKAVTIETDGAIEVVDPLRVCENGFTRNDLNVHHNEISDIENLKLYQIYYNSHEELCDKCLACPVQHICGGGYLGHRYSKFNEFENPSIYCRDIMKLISHIQNNILKRLPEYVVKELKLDTISYNEIYDQVYIEPTYSI